MVLTKVVDEAVSQHLWCVRLSKHWRSMYHIGDGQIFRKLGSETGAADDLSASALKPIW